MIRSITYAIQENARPRKTPNDSILLKHGRTYKVLVNATGNLTKADKEYERLTTKSLETSSYDPKQTLKRVGNMETVKLSGGKERLVRTFDPTADDGPGKYKYTSLGKMFFCQKKSSKASCSPEVSILHVPQLKKASRSMARLFFLLCRSSSPLAKRAVVKTSRS